MRRGPYFFFSNSWLTALTSTPQVVTGAPHCTWQHELGMLQRVLCFWPPAWIQGCKIPRCDWKVEGMWHHPVCADRDVVCHVPSHANSTITATFSVFSHIHETASILSLFTDPAFKSGGKLAKFVNFLEAKVCFGLIFSPQQRGKLTEHLCFGLLIATYEH